MYICVKLPLKNLNSNPYPLHSTNNYTCRVIIALKVCVDDKCHKLLYGNVYTFSMPVFSVAALKFVYIYYLK